MVNIQIPPDGTVEEFDRKHFEKMHLQCIQIVESFSYKLQVSERKL